MHKDKKSNFKYNIIFMMFIIRILGKDKLSGLILRVRHIGNIN